MTAEARVDWNAILGLINDPLFQEFEQSLGAPSIFNAVGRTHTETWHSAMLGWLLNPSSNHGLGEFPLKKFILSLKILDNHGNCPIDLGKLLVCGNFSLAEAVPNEKNLVEKSIPNIGRLDVCVEHIHLEEKTGQQNVELCILVEMKVKAPIEKEQCAKYRAYIDEEKKAGRLILPVFVAPMQSLRKNETEQWLKDESWITLNFQELYDELIEPCLQHPSLSTFGRYTLQEYVKTLKSSFKGGKSMIVSQEDREMVKKLLEKHGDGIQALRAIMSEEEEIDTQLQSTSGSPRPSAITLRLQINGTELSGHTIKELYQKTLEYLYKGKYLSNMELPYQTGSKRYLLVHLDNAQEPIHPGGGPFLAPVRYEGYCMEAHKSREGGLRDLINMLDQGLNLSAKVVEDQPATA